MLLSSLVTKVGHVCVFPGQSGWRVSRPFDVRSIEDIGPLRMVLLLLALGGHIVHEVLHTAGV